MTLNNLGLYIFLPLSIAIGFSLASQAGVNAQLRLALSSPTQAAFISFLIGTVILGAILIIQGEIWFKPASLAGVPWWAWLGGVFGAFNITVAVYLVPKLGAVVLTLSVVCGQIIASLILDQNGWLGYPKIDITFNRIIGVVLIIFGVFFVAKS